MKQLRIAIFGFGVVGQGFAELLASKQDLFRTRCDFEVKLVSVANSRGLIYREQGLDIPTLLELAANRKALTQHPSVQHWPDALAGLSATGADVLAEVTGTNLRDAEPGMSHIRAALTQGIHVITANKGPGALAAIELTKLAQEHHVQLRMEATVMAGTPVLSTIHEGLAGARVRTIRGILNGTTNYILSAMASGRAYHEVLAEAQAQGYAEADPTADVEGFDAAAKALILAALVFGHTITLDQIVRQGITHITKEQLHKAGLENKRIKLITSLHAASHLGSSPLEVRVEPQALALSDPLAHVDGTMNAISFQTDTLSEVTVIGPGAGRIETGQGLLADLIAIVRSL